MNEIVLSTRRQALPLDEDDPVERSMALDAILGAAVDAALTGAGARAAQVLLFDQRQQRFTAVATRGATGATLQLWRTVEQATPMLKTIMISGRSCYLRAGDSAAGNGAMLAGLDQGVAVVPLQRVNDQPLGVALLTGLNRPAFERASSLLTGLGWQLGAAVEQVRLLESERARIRHELVNAQARIAEQTAQIQAIVAQAAEAIYVCDAQGQIVLANLPAAQMFGFASPAAMSRPVSDLAAFVDLRTPAGEPLGAGDVILQRALQSGNIVKGDYAIVNPQTGEESYRRISAGPLIGPDGGIQGAVAVASDISALVELQRLSEIEADAAKHQRQRLQAIIDALADPVCVFDTDWRLLLVNQRLLQMWSLPSDIVGRHATELDDLVPGRFIQMEATELVTSLEQRVHAAAVDEVTVGAPPRVFRRAASGVYDETGRPIAYIFLYHDITPLREIERLKDEFLATVSHDLRSPLHHIKGYTSTLLRADVAWDAATQRRFLHIIDRECDRMAQLVGNLLDLSRLEAAEATWLDLDTCDLAEIVSVAVDRVRAAVASHPITLDLAPSLPHILGDARWLDQLVVNLLDNAAKYAPPGSPIAVALRPADQTVLLSVTDQGIGIAAEHLTAIFDRFYRAPNGSRVRGSGLGLAICQRIVKAHGGRIWVESEPGRGSTFTVSLPWRPTP